MAFDALKEQLKTTTRRLEQGELQLSDRIFLNHILDELDVILENGVPSTPSGYFDLAESTLEMLGSTNELVEDGLDD
jgi:hypothetical protein